MTTEVSDFDRELFDALREAFPKAAELSEFVYLSLGRNLAEIVDEGGNLRAQALDLIRDMRARGELLALVKAARRERPANPRVAALSRHPEVEPYLRALPTPNEVGELRKLIEDAGLEAEACTRAFGAAGDGSSKLSVGDMVWHLADFPVTKGFPRLAEFALRLAMAPEATPIRCALRDWAQGHADRHGCAAGVVDRRADELDRLELGGYVVVVDLDGDAGRGYAMSAWLTRDGGRAADALPVEQLEGVRFEEISARVEELLASDAWAPIVERCDRLRIELVVPLATLKAATPDLGDLGVTHDVVVRCRERIDRKLRGEKSTLWKRKSAACLDSQRPTEWLPGSDAEALTKALWQSGLLPDDRVAFAVCVKPSALTDEQRQQVVEGALQRGVPVMAWLRADAASADPDPSVVPLTKHPPRAALERLREAVQATVKSASADDSACRVVLLWDFWDRLPPNRQRGAAMSAPAQK